MSSEKQIGGLGNVIKEDRRRNMMKKSDLKDGMVLTLRIGRKFSVINGIKLFSHESRLICALRLSDYRDNLTRANSDYDKDDIVKVEYMGETLWERKEYVAFDEARKSGKSIRFKDWEKGFYTLSEAFQYLWSVSEYEANKMIDLKGWEIEK